MSGAIVLRAALSRLQVSITDHGGKADGATDSDAPLAAAVTALGGAGTVKFPLVPGAGNVYYFAAFNAASYIGIEFDVDPGVTLSLPSNEIVEDGNAVNFRFTRPTRFYFRSLNDYYTVSPDGGTVTLTDGEQRVMPRLAAPDADRSFPVAITASGMTPRKIAWNASDVWNADAFSASSAQSFSLAPANDGALHFGMTPCKPGDEFVCSFSAAGGVPLIAAVVRHTGGFAGVWSQADYNAATTNYFHKETGVAGANAALNFQGSGTHGSYSALGALWTIRIDSWSAATVMLNGYAVAHFNTAGYIFECGFGLSPTGAGQSATINDVVRIRGALYRGAEFLSVRVYGDSKAADRYDAWPRYFKDALEFACGVRCWRVINRAVAGQGVAAQMAIMAGDAVNDSNIVIIDIGTNDVQALTDLATFVADLTAMVNQALAAGCYVILGVPSLWYPQALAGGRGQNALNYDKGAPYRAAILRLAAEKAVRVVDNTRFDGPVLRDYVNPVTVDLTAAGDPVVCDNIHPTTETNKRRALAYARVSAALVARKAGDLYLPPHIMGAAANGWSTTIQAPRATVSAGGLVKLYGLVNDLGGAVRVDGTAIFILPPHLCPRDVIRIKYPAASNNADVITLNVDTSGNVTVFGAVASTWISLDAIAFSIEDREAL